MLELERQPWAYLDKLMFNMDMVETKSCEQNNFHSMYRYKLSDLDPCICGTNIGSAQSPLILNCQQD
jgi:hypothetical protein